MDATREDEQFSLPPEAKPFFDRLRHLIRATIMRNENEELPSIRQGYVGGLSPILPVLAPEDHRLAVVDIEMNDIYMRPSR